MLAGTAETGKAGIQIQVVAGHQVCTASTGLYGKEIGNWGIQMFVKVQIFVLAGHLYFMLGAMPRAIT